MDLSGLDRRPGRVVEAEVYRRYNALVSFDPLSSSSEFFLVLSVGRCKFRLLEHSVSLILQSVIGGQAPAFRVLCLADRVFRFSVHSQEVGFHIYRLRSFECANFKIYFHLWHGGGPNFCYEYKLWMEEQSSEWVNVVRNTQKSKPLSGANLVRLGTRRVLRPNVQNSNPLIHGYKPVFNRFKPVFKPAFNPALKGILGPHPSTLNGRLHDSGPVRRDGRSAGPTRQSNELHSGNHRPSPQLARTPDDAAPAIGIFSNDQSMTHGTSTGNG